MKVKYNKEVDVLYISFSDNPVIESEEDKPGITLDYDDKGSIIGIEVLNSSKQILQPQKFGYEVA